MKNNKKIKINSFFSKNNKGLSGVITAVILIALAFALVTVVWVVVSDLVQEELDDAESCFGVFGEVTINSRYTCYNSSSNELQFSISVKNINVEEIIIAISGEGATKSFIITNEENTIANLTNYPSGSSGIKLPGKNAGLTYVADSIFNKPDSIEIAPIINGKQCEVSDSLSEIDNCLSLI